MSLFVEAVQGQTAKGINIQAKQQARKRKGVAAADRRQHPPLTSMQMLCC
jgi:hypothetical protein